MSRWWRAHDDAVDNSKLCLLSDRQHRAWFNLMCLASASGGCLPDMKVVALKLRMSAAKAGSLVAELREVGLFDKEGEGVAPHNWSKRQFKSDVTDATGAERQQRYRDRHRNGENNAVTGGSNGPVTVTPEYRVQSTDRKEDAADAALPSDLERQLFSRGKEIAGKDAGGLIVKLLKAKKGDVALARSAVELASTKQNPREFIAAIVTGGKASVEGRRLTNDEEYYGVGRIPGVV